MKPTDPNVGNRWTGSLLERVFACTTCPQRYGFSRSESGPYFKFPPTIGASGTADLLFVGINPRLSGNKPLFERLMEHRETFEDLAQNRDGERAYIAVGGPECHYETHMKIVEGVYGTGSKFEEHAAVTELFFCATKKAPPLQTEGSDCADTYFDDVFEQVQPKIVVCLGESVLGYFQALAKVKNARRFQLAIGNRLASVVCVPHPGNREISEDVRKVCVCQAIEAIRLLLGPPSRSR